MNGDENGEQKEEAKASPEIANPEEKPVEIEKTQVEKTKDSEKVGNTAEIVEPNV